jgi:hypothetical protein
VPRRRSFGAWHLIVLSALFAGLNAGKPLMIDDGAYQYFARQVARAPLDPYGFAVFWYDVPQPANEVLAPPVLPYYWGLVRAVVGEAPWAWKLALWPWAGLLVWGVHGLGVRFCRGAEGLATWGVVLSPALLPGFNLMLDVPALALGLSAVRLFVGAVDGGSVWWAAWAGLAAGLAMETKYTAFTVPGAMLLYAGGSGRWRLWPVAALGAGQVFVGWELLTALLYGRSHFLTALGDGGPVLAKLGMLPTLTSDLGGVGAVGLLVVLLGVRAGRLWLALGAGVVAAGLGAIVLFDVRFRATAGPSGLVFGPGREGALEFQLAEVIFQGFGLAGSALVGWVCWLLLRRGRDRDAAFLVLWLGLEVAGFVAMTPFPAVRRVLGVWVVLGLLVGRLSARTCRGGWRRRGLSALVGAGCVLALGFAALDWRGAQVHREAAEGSARWARERGGGEVWYVGHWGFQFYAERAGMRAVVPDYDPAGAAPEPGRRPVALPGPSRLRAGDWLVVPDGRLNQQNIRLDGGKVELAGTLRFGARVPLRTVPCFYGGRTPVEHHEGPRLEVRVYRVVEDFVPRPAEEPPFEAGGRGSGTGVR